MPDEPPLEAFEPVVDANCRVLILGSFPGQASLRAGHYYAHPTNLFWPVMSAALGIELTGMAFEARYRCLREAGVGLWDVIERCRREGSLDASIREARPAGLLELAASLPRLRCVLLNGRTAERHGRALAWPRGITLQAMPSTSAAYASMPAARKRECWLSALDEALGSEVS